MARSSFSWAMLKSAKDRMPTRTGGGNLAESTVEARCHDEKDSPPSAEMGRGGTVQRLIDDLAPRPRNTEDLIMMSIWSGADRRYDGPSRFDPIHRLRCWLDFRGSCSLFASSCISIVA